jgi:hypothetical protein
MNLSALKLLFADNGCQKIYVKKLAPNDNSKNQVYLARGSWEFLNILRVSSVESVPIGDFKRARFKAKLNFSWIGEDSKLYPAPNAQLILYPDYPEIRFSGFLTKCENPPSELMTQRLADRLLFLAVAGNGTILGFVTAPDSEIAIEYNKAQIAIEYGLFKVIDLPLFANSKMKLLGELLRIHQLGWIKSKSLTKSGIVPCEASQCGGYTLEAELGIIRNGIAEPDYLGWEIKNFSVTNFNRINSKVITLMTPEPTGGYYKREGILAFIKKYGYPDVSGIEDRMNFGGIHKTKVVHHKTNLELQLIGFDTEIGKIKSADGRIALIDKEGNEAASWNFSSLLEHWNKKHNQACYVPSLLATKEVRQYKYGSKVILGSGTDFQFFLGQMATGNIYLDPASKVENISSKPKTKQRSQFRIKSQHLASLYKVNEVVDITA